MNLEAIKRQGAISALYGESKKQLNLLRANADAAEKALDNKRDAHLFFAAMEEAQERINNALVTYRELQALRP